MTAYLMDYYTHATPTLFNSGLKMQQLSSCFLIGMEDDSIEGIFNTIKDCALISKDSWWYWNACSQYKRKW